MCFYGLDLTKKSGSFPSQHYRQTYWVYVRGAWTISCQLSLQHTSRSDPATPQGQPQHVTPIDLPCSALFSKEDNHSSSAAHLHGKFQADVAAGSSNPNCTTAFSNTKAESYHDPFVVPASSVQTHTQNSFHSPPPPRSWEGTTFQCQCCATQDQIPAVLLVMSINPLWIC